MAYPLTTLKDYDDEIKKVRDIIADLESEEDEIFKRGNESTISHLFYKIEILEEMKKEKFVSEQMNLL